MGETCETCTKVACSAGVFWVGETLFVFVIVVATISDFMTVEDWGE